MEISALEERLRLAELGPDPGFFDAALADNAVVVGDGGEPIIKSTIVAAHQPGHGPKFTRVDMSDLTILDHGAAAVVTCRGRYEGPGASVTLRFMRVWVKLDGHWQIVAGSVSTT
jgi:hypothetical protein